MKKHLVVFAGLCFAMSMVAQNVSIQTYFSGFTKENGDKFVGSNSNAELKQTKDNNRDLIIDFDLKGKGLNFVPDTVLLNIYGSSVDKTDSFAIVAYGMNHYTCTGYVASQDIKTTEPKYTEARAMGGLLCDSIITCQDACVGKFIQFDVKAIMDSLTTDSILGFRLEARNLSKVEPWAKFVTVRGSANQRPYLYFAKGQVTALQQTKAASSLVNAQYGQIRLNNVADGQVVTVYNMQGQLVAKEVVKGGNFNAEVPANYYIVNVK